MHVFHSRTPDRGRDDYLANELPVYFRLHAHYTGREHTFTVARGIGKDEYFLSPHASVIAARKLTDSTPIIEVSTGEQVRIDGLVYQVRDDRQLNYPRLTLVQA